MKRMKLIISCNSCHWMIKSQQITQITQKVKSVKSVQSVDNKRKVCGGLFVLHKLISLCHAVIEFAMAIHINLCFDRLLQALQE